LVGSASLAALTGLSLAVFGREPWVAFQQSLGFTRSVVLEQGNTGWEKIQSVFSATRMLGGSITEAYALQALVGALVLGAVAWLWHSQSDIRLKYAALLCAALLTTPYCLDYDMVLLGPAVAFMVAHGMEKGISPFATTVLVAAWLVPLVARMVAKLSYIPIGPVIMVALFVAILARATSEAVTAKSARIASVERRLA
jgi:hypothetical protein